MRRLTWEFWIVIFRHFYVRERWGQDARTHCFTVLLYWWCSSSFSMSMNTYGLLWKSVTTMPLSRVWWFWHLPCEHQQHLLICGSHARYICPSCAEINWIQYCSVHYGLERMLFPDWALLPPSPLIVLIHRTRDPSTSAHGPWLNRSMGVWSNDRTSFCILKCSLLWKKYVKMLSNWKFFFMKMSC